MRRCSGQRVAKKPEAALPVLVAACSFQHAKGAQKPFYAWVVAASRQLGVAPDDLRKAVLARDWVSAEVRKAVTAKVKGPLKPKSQPKK